MTERDPRSSLPGVDVLLASAGGVELVETYGTRRVTEALRTTLESARRRLASGEGSVEGVPTAESLVEAAGVSLLERRRHGLRPVLNATGVVLHTNLGRAPIAAPAADAMVRAASGYSNLEFDLREGSRGSRYDHCVPEIRELTGAADGLVVNNCAGGLLLAMQALARGGRAVVSRGELVEIGGGFRIPEVLASAGTELVEVGSTNRTRVADYAAALSVSPDAVILKVHRSNFRISGFTEEAELSELVRLGRERGVPVVHDLGSGLLLDPGQLGLPPEPTPRESITAGADLVIFSGDKLLGGPQAGVIAGRSEMVARLRAAPLCRALRVDKVTLAGLRATLELLLDPAHALKEIPALRCLATSRDDLRTRAQRVAVRLPAEVAAEVVDCDARVGGGTYPDVAIPSAAVALTPPGGAEAFARALRLGEPSVVARTEDGRVLVDLRAVDASQDDRVTEALLAACGVV